MLSWGLLAGWKIGLNTAGVPSNLLKSMIPSEPSLSQRAVIKTHEMVYGKGGGPVVKNLPSNSAGPIPGRGTKISQAN